MVRFQGIVYRAIHPQWSWSPVSGEGSRLRGGRFNRIGVPALYTSLSPMTAVREASPLRRPMQPMVLCAYDVDTDPIFDALSRTRRRDHSVTEADLHCPRWKVEMCSGTIPASQALADRLLDAGYVGMRVRSFAPAAGPDDVNLVLWRWSDRRPSRVVLIDDEGRLPKRGAP